MDPAMPTHSRTHRLKTPVRLEFLGSGKTAFLSSSRPLEIFGKPEARLRISYERGIQASAGSQNSASYVAVWPRLMLQGI